jgi:Fe-S-cluster containining protein
MPADPVPSQGGRTPLPLVRLQAGRGDAAGAPTATATIGLKIGAEPTRLEITVPAGAARPRDLLPVFQGLTDVVVGVAVREVERQGEKISCRAGCGACCRQLVPIAGAEAHNLKRLVDALPEPRQSRVRARFAEVRAGLAAAGLLDQLRQRGPEAAPLREVGLAYFRLGLPCPFLEDESCSIHAERPLACHEYLVTSPAEHCARPTADTVRMVKLPAGPAAALRGLDREASAAAWVPLALALEWAKANPEPPPRTGPALLEEFFGLLTREATPR